VASRNGATATKTHPRKEAGSEAAKSRKSQEEKARYLLEKARRDLKDLGKRPPQNRPEWYEVVLQLHGGYLRARPAKGDKPAYREAIALPVCDQHGSVVGVKLRYLGAGRPKSRTIGSEGLLGYSQLAEKPDATIAIASGERDLMTGLTVCAHCAWTSPSNGEAQDLSSFAPVLQSRDTVLLPDVDGPGRKDEAKQCRLLAEQGVTLRVARVPLDGSPKSKDLSDWLAIFADGQDAEGAAALTRLIDGAQPCAASCPAPLSGQTSKPGCDAAVPRPKEPKVAERPLIQINADLPGMVTLAQEALLTDRETELYTRGGVLVRVIRHDSLTRKEEKQVLVRPQGLPVIAPADIDWVMERLAAAAEWQKWSSSAETWVPSLPSRQAVKSLMARREWKFAYLESVVEHPALRPDGTVLQEPGYDEITGTLLRPIGDFPPVPECPSASDLATAVSMLLEPIREFSFVCSTDRAAAMALTLSIVARPAIDGPAPLFGVTATTPGEGKGLLVDVLTASSGGRSPSVGIWSTEAEEQRKLVFAALMEGAPVVLLDNVEGLLGGAVLAALLTARSFTDRLLGVSKRPTAPARAIWIATGNNLQYKGDTYRRVVPIHLDGKTEKPEERAFRIADLRAFVAERRARLCSAALTVLRAYHCAGRPPHGAARIGSFESWDDLVRGCVVWAFDADPAGGREKVRTEADPEMEAMTALVAHWFAVFGDGILTIKAAVEAAKPKGEGLYTTGGHPVLLAAMEAVASRKGGGTDAGTLGYPFRKWNGRVLGGLRLERCQKGEHGVEWRVTQVAPRGGDDARD
jgi:putative DNA primase/helicase